MRNLHGRRARAALILGLLGALGALVACEPYDGPRASCFGLMEGAPCTFEALPAPDGWNDA